MIEPNNDVVVRFTYDKRTTIDEGHDSPKAVAELFYFYSKNNTLAYSYEQAPLGQRDGEPDRMYKTLKQLSDSDAKNLIDTLLIQPLLRQIKVDIRRIVRLKVWTKAKVRVNTSLLSVLCMAANTSEMHLICHFLSTKGCNSRFYFFKHNCSSFGCGY